MEHTLLMFSSKKNKVDDSEKKFSSNKKNKVIDNNEKNLDNIFTIWHRADNMAFFKCMEKSFGVEQKSSQHSPSSTTLFKPTQRRRVLTSKKELLKPKGLTRSPSV